MTTPTTDPYGSTFPKSGNGGGDQTYQMQSKDGGGGGPFDPVKPTSSGLSGDSGVEASAAQVGAATGYQASTFNDNERAQAATREMQDNETVAGQLRGIIDENSPLLQRARQQAMSGMNARGLLNSSMAAGAGTAALYDKALDIATPDAAAYLQTARDNSALKTDVSKFNAGETNQTGRFNAGLITDASKFLADQTNQTARFNTGEMNRVGISNAGNRTQIQQQSMSDAAAYSRAQLSAQTQITTQQMQGDTQRVIAQMNNDSAKVLEGIRSQNAAELQSSASAQAIYTQGLANIQAIQNNANLTEDTKQRMIDEALMHIQNGMKLSGAVSGLNLAAALDFSGAEQRVAARTNRSPAATPEQLAVGEPAPTNNNSQGGPYTYNGRTYASATDWQNAMLQDQQMNTAGA